MRYPVLMIAATLAMEDVEERALMTAEVQPRFWKRYIDDTHTALSSGQGTNVLHHLNSIELSINFTVEVKLNRGLHSWKCYCKVTLMAPSWL